MLQHKLCVLLNQQEQQHYLFTYDARHLYLMHAAWSSLYLVESLEIIISIFFEEIIVHELKV